MVRLAKLSRPLFVEGCLSVQSLRAQRARSIARAMEDAHCFSHLWFRVLDVYQESLEQAADLRLFSNEPHDVARSLDYPALVGCSHQSGTPEMR